MCASISQPPETQSRLRRVWGSQEGHEENAQAPYSFDHLTAYPGGLSTLFANVDLNIALSLTFPASMATDLLCCPLPTTSEAIYGSVLV